MNVWQVQIVGIFLTLFCGLIIIQQVLAGAKPIRQKLGILGKKSLLPKKFFLQLPTSFKKVNMCKKSVKIILSWFRNAMSCRKFFFGKRLKKWLLPKKNFLHDITLRNQLSIIFTDFLHMSTFLKLVGSCRKIFFGKSDFFPKIPNFCRMDLPPAKNYWMIMSPQKRVKKIPTICICQTFIYYVNRLKTNFQVIFKTQFRAKKISKIIMGPQTFKTHHIFSGNVYPDVGLSLSVAETRC